MHAVQVLRMASVRSGSRKLLLFMQLRSRARGTCWNWPSLAQTQISQRSFTRSYTRGAAGSRR